MTHPGVGPITGLVYILVIGTTERFPSGKKLGSYTGLIPSEDSSAGQQRLGDRVAAPPFCLLGSHP
jgi:transposase